MASAALETSGPTSAERAIDRQSAASSVGLRPPRGRLYTIADVDALGSLGAVPDAVTAMAEAGVEWIQVRAKGVPGGPLLTVLDTCCRRLEGSTAKLWIDDRVDLAASSSVAGVHVGQDDLAPAEARRLLGPNLAIGFSTHDLDQLVAADGDPAVDVIALGPIFSTTSKQRPGPVVGLETLAQARARTRKPLVAIGGIEATRLASVLATGADAAVVLGAVCRGDVLANCKRLLALAREVE